MSGASTPLDFKLTAPRSKTCCNFSNWSGLRRWPPLRPLLGVGRSSGSCTLVVRHAALLDPLAFSPSFCTQVTLPQDTQACPPSSCTAFASPDNSNLAPAFFTTHSLTVAMLPKAPLHCSARLRRGHPSRRDLTHPTIDHWRLLTRSAELSAAHTLNTRYQRTVTLLANHAGLRR